MARQTPKLPVEDDFPSKCVVKIYPAGDGKPAANAILMLHGLGDSAANFAVLGQRMNLPETVTVAIQGPAALPFDLGGYHWGDDITFDQATSHMDIDTGFSKSATVVRQVIDRVLVEACGFQRRRIHVFGLGQGGMVALSVAQLLADEELGGVVSLGGPLPAENSNRNQTKSPTPVLVAHGSSQTAVTINAAKMLKAAFATVKFHRWDRSGDGMPSNRQEMLPVMQFLAQRLQSYAGVPSEAIEIV
ncbi:MAG: hypothetical protein Q9162_004369 [Coniocarpon cinnabarinum]